MRIRVELPDFQAAWQRLEECHKDAGSDNNPLNMRLLGVSGVGKTFLLQEYRNAFPMVAGEEVTRVPVLYLSIPSAPNRKSIYAAFLRGLGVDPGRGNTEQYQRRVMRLCEASMVEFVFVDEIHHFIDRGKAHSYATAADALKEMLDLIGRPFVLAGAPRARILFDHNSQLRSRVMGTFRLLPFDLESLGSLMGYLYAITEALPQEQREWIATPEVATRIFFATDGVHRNIATWIKLVTNHAKAAGHIDYAQFADLFRTRIWSPDRKSFNPFEKDFEMRRLNRDGEPFQPTYLDGDNHDPSFLRMTMS